VGRSQGIAAKPRPGAARSALVTFRLLYLIFARLCGWLALHHMLSEYVGHYTTHRPHRALSQRPPPAGTQIAPADDTIRVRRRDRLGGLIHEYSQVA
jgi:hypothetical protein